MVRSTRSNFTAPEIWPIQPVEHLQASNLNPRIMAAPTPIEWKTNPFSSSFNPATKIGQQIFIEKTKGLPDGTRYDLSKENASELHQFFKTRQATLGKCIQVPVTYANDGSASSTANLITQHSKIPLANVQRAAIKRFGTEVLAPTALPTGPFIT